jgi:uncharacterized protein HemY
MKKIVLVKSLFIFIVLVLQCSNSRANNIDSLLKALPQVKDTQKVLLQIKIGKFYLKNREFDDAFNYYNQSLTESKKIKYIVGEALANQYIAKLYSRKTVYDTSAVY